MCEYKQSVPRLTANVGFDIHFPDIRLAHQKHRNIDRCKVHRSLQMFQDSVQCYLSKSIIYFSAVEQKM